MNRTLPGLVTLLLMLVAGTAQAAQKPGSFSIDNAMQALQGSAQR